MHTAGGQNLYTPGFKSRKDTIKEDVDFYKSVAKMAEEENSYPPVNIFDEYLSKSVAAAGIYGSFSDFCHFMLGVPSIAIECWDLNVRAGIEMTYPPKEERSQAEEEDMARKCLKWADENLTKEEGFKDWTEYDHPQLGKVEIGGYNSKFFMQNPPHKFLHQEVEKHTRFAHRLIKTLPQVKFDTVTSEKIADGIYKVEAVVGNHGFMPSYVFKEGLKLKTLKELSVSMNGAFELIEGKKEEKIGHLGGLMNINAHNSPLGPSSKHSIPLCKKITWIIKANEGTELDFVCQGGRIGKVTSKITL